MEMKQYTVTWRDRAYPPRGELRSADHPGKHSSTFNEFNDQKALSMGRALRACPGIEDVEVTVEEPTTRTIEVPEPTLVSGVPSGFPESAEVDR